MKKTILISVVLCFIFISSNAQEKVEVEFKNDSIFIDTLNRNLVGLNLYPALSMLGGGRMPNTKIYLQYKRYYERMNLRTSLNFINYYRPNEKTDYIGMFTDTLVTDTATYIRDTMMFRRFNNNIYSYDYRFGLEAAFPQENFRFHVGAGIILGYQYVGESYYHYGKNSDSLPVSGVNFSRNPVEVGNIKTHFLKTGIDFSVGVDINVTPNIIFTIQYTPEFAYYRSFRETKTDPDLYYNESLGDRFVFTPDYIDFVVNIRF